MSPRRLAALGLAVLGLALPAVAQQTEDLTEEDRRYLERIRARREAPPPPPDPEQARAEIRRRFLEQADVLIRDKNYRRASTARYEVKSDDPRLDVDATAVLLESFRSWFEDFWSDRVALLPYDDSSRMYLFWSYYKYNQLFSGKERFDEFKTAGHYRGFLDVVVVHTDGTPPADLADTLVHEAAHQMIRQRLLGESAAPPSWLSEGLADYFGLTEQARDGDFVEGDVGAKTVWPFRDLPRSKPGGALGRLRDLRDRLEKDPSWSVDGVVRADPTVFYGPGIRANYAAAWVLVHYLLHGDDGRHAERFADWIVRDVREGGSRTLYEALAVDAADLHRGFTTHIRTIRAR